MSSFDEFRSRDSRIEKLKGRPKKGGAAYDENRKVGWFLKGPTPLVWLAMAAKCPGKSLHVAVVIRFLSGLKRTPTLQLNTQYLRYFGVDRYSTYRALRWLEAAGLIEVERKSGTLPVVTIRELRAGHEE